jgi:hypothetical protein
MSEATPWKSFFSISLLKTTIIKKFGSGTVLRANPQ